MNYQLLAHLSWILPLALLVIYIGSPRFLGTMGSSRVRRMLGSALEKSRYTLLHDLILPVGGGSMHFDLIIVSQYGIHVIDAVHRPGRISGTEAQARWRQKYLGRQHFFANPVHANILRVEALGRLLGLPLSRFHPVVAFSGYREFKKPIPGNVVGANKLLRKIRSDTRQLLAPEEADEAILKLQNARIRPALLGRSGRWKMLRVFLLIALLAGVYFVYGNAITSALLDLQRQADVSMAPERFHPDGSAKTKQELWEDRLICAYSIDTDRCVCREPNGARARIDKNRCRDLAERGSILRQ